MVLLHIVCGLKFESFNDLIDFFWDSYLSKGYARFHLDPATYTDEEDSLAMQEDLHRILSEHCLNDLSLDLLYVCQDGDAEYILGTSKDVVDTDKDTTILVADFPAILVEKFNVPQELIALHFTTLE